jgi:hypothetical protein
VDLAALVTEFQAEVQRWRDSTVEGDSAVRVDSMVEVDSTVETDSVKADSTVQ